jgi:ubiquinol-cytochrome c reductase cytochrome b subunit
MKSKIYNWINDRFSIEDMFNSAFDEKIPGGSSFFFTLGSATLFVFALQVITGVWQLFYYVPTVDHAYDSLSYLRIFVPYGWLIQGIHYWGANLMAVLIALHIVRVFIWGAYKKPRELTWLIGIVLLLLTVGLIFTGAALPWDERGYWAAEVGTSIAGTVPFIGHFLISFLRGGITMSQLTLSRFFAFHVAILPGITFLLVAFHLMAFRQFGSIGPWKKSKRTKIENFWPGQVAKDLMVSGLILLLLIGLSAYVPAPFTGPADPSDAAFLPKPEWNFLFLYQLLKSFAGSAELIGTVGIPSLILILFILVPFIDRKKSFNPAKRPGMMIGGFIMVAFIFTFTLLGYFSKPPGAKSKSTPVQVAVAAKKVSKIIKLSPTAIYGKKIFETSGCTACHTISGVGGKICPDLTNEHERKRSEKWLITQITDSKSHYKTSMMPNYTHFTKKQLSELTAYLLSPHPKQLPLPPNKIDSLPSYLLQKNVASAKMQPQSVNEFSWEASTAKTLKKLGHPGQAASIIGNVALGSKLFRNYCEACHGVQGRGGVSNPGSLLKFVPRLNPVSKVLFNNDPQKFADNIDRFIQHGVVPEGSHPALKMFNYGDSYALTQPEIASIEAYVLYLNNVNRAEIQSPPSARQFFALAVWIFIGVTIILIIIGLVYKKAYQKSSDDSSDNEVV